MLTCQTKTKQKIKIKLKLELRRKPELVHISGHEHYQFLHSIQ